MGYRYGRDAWSVEERCDPRLLSLFSIDDDHAEAWLAGRARCLTDLFFLCKEVMGYTDFYEPLHRPMCDFVQGMDDHPQLFTVNVVPRGHFKTSVELGAMMQALLRNPNERLLLTHGKKDMACSYLDELKRKCCNVTMLRWLFPDVIWNDPEREAPAWKKDCVTFIRQYDNKVPSILAGGIDAPVTGFHFSKQYADDVVYETNSASPEMREKVREWRRNSLPQTEEPETLRVLWSATRWHHEDATHEFMEAAAGRGEFVDHARVFFRAALQDSLGRPDLGGEPVFPTRYTKKALSLWKVALGSYRFSCHYMNDPTPEGVAKFRDSDIVNFRLNEEGHPPTDEHYVYFTSVDPNRSEKTAGDPCAIVTAAVTETGKMWVVDVYRGHPSGLELIEQLKAHVKQWNPVRVFFEENFFQQQMRTWVSDRFIEQEVQARLVPVKGSTANRKVDRILALQPLVESRGFHLREGLESFRSEMTRWTGKRLDRDDQLDAVAYIFAEAVRNRQYVAKRKKPVNPDRAASVLADAGLGGLDFGPPPEDEDVVVHSSPLAYRDARSLIHFMR